MKVHPNPSKLFARWQKFLQQRGEITKSESLVGPILCSCMTKASAVTFYIYVCVLACDAKFNKEEVSNVTAKLFLSDFYHVCFHCGHCCFIIICLLNEAQNVRKARIASVHFSYGVALNESFVHCCNPQFRSQSALILCPGRSVLGHLWPLASTHRKTTKPQMCLSATLSSGQRVQVCQQNKSSNCVPRVRQEAGEKSKWFLLLQLLIINHKLTQVS